MISIVVHQQVSFILMNTLLVYLYTNSSSVRVRGCEYYISIPILAFYHV